MPASAPVLPFTTTAPIFLADAYLRSFRQGGGRWEQKMMSLPLSRRICLTCADEAPQS